MKSLWYFMHLCVCILVISLCIYSGFSKERTIGDHICINGMIYINNAIQLDIVVFIYIIHYILFILHMCAFIICIVVFYVCVCVCVCVLIFFSRVLGECVISSVLSHHNKNLKQQTRLIGFRWTSVTAPCFSSVLFRKQRKIHP